MDKKMNSKKGDQPQKDILESTLWNFLIVLLILIPVLFCFDGFVLHDLSMPSGHFLPMEGDTPEFDLFTTDSPYASYECLDRFTFSHSFHVYLVANEGETHLLVVEFHFITDRGRIVGDLTIDPMVTETYKVGAYLGNYHIPISDGKIGEMVEFYGLQKDGPVIYSPIMATYVLLAGAIAAAECLLYRKYLMKKYGK